MNFFKMITGMATPTPILAAVDPAAAARRLERRAAWRIARPIRFGWHHSSNLGHGPPPAQPTSSSTAPDPASRPVRQAMAPADLASIENTARGAAHFVPRQSARVLAEIAHDRPVGEVRDNFRELVHDIQELQSVPRVQLIAAVDAKRATR